MFDNVGFLQVFTVWTMEFLPVVLQRSAAMTRRSAARTSN